MKTLSTYRSISNTYNKKTAQIVSIQTLRTIPLIESIYRRYAHRQSFEISKQTRPNVFSLFPRILQGNLNFILMPQNKKSQVIVTNSYVDLHDTSTKEIVHLSQFLSTVPAKHQENGCSITDFITDKYITGRCCDNNIISVRPS